MDVPDRYIDPPDADEGHYERCLCECHDERFCNCDECDIEDCECNCHMDHCCTCDCEDGWVFVPDDPNDDGDAAFDAWHDER